MEQTADAVVVPLDAGWNDVGSWSALWEISEKDTKGNSTFGDVLEHNCSNNYIRAEHKLVAAVGVTNLVVVETKDAVLIADKDNVQDVKEIVNQLKRQKRSESKQHREVYRPWGKHDAIAQGDRFLCAPHYCKARREIVLADAPSSFGTLGSGVRHCQSAYQW